MANRMYNQFQGSLEKGVVQLFLEATFTGADWTLTRGKGIGTIFSGAAGLYFIELQDTYNRLLGVSAIIQGPSATTQSIAPIVQIRNASVDTDTKQVGLAITNYSGVLTDPAAGEKIFVTITLSNSTAL